MPVPNLKYFWEAEFYDGRIIKQHPQDISLKFPPTYNEAGEPQGKSSIVDIQDDLDANLIEKFSLIGAGQKVTVNLQKGIFFVNGLPVVLESEILPGRPEKFELLRYYKVNQNMNVTFALKSKEVLATESLPEYREYYIGWKCVIAGREYKQVIGLA